MTDSADAIWDDKEKTARLRLARSRGVGPITFRDLVARYGSAGDALEALPDLARKAGRKGPGKIPSADDLRHEVERVRALGGQFVFLGAPDYPLRLAAIDDAPPVLQMLGTPELAHRDSIAVVGARNASAAGLSIARTLAGALGEAGYAVVSGLARGIDGAAHTASLERGTIACIAGGLDVTYPREHAPLQQDIAENGLIVSEMPLGTKPQARHFPRRNRIISGLSLGVLVVEAAARSGSLITARLALEQGRDVFAVPGSPLDPRAKGCNRLIRDGAQLTETIDDILEALPLAGRPIIAAKASGPVTAATPTASDLDDKAAQAIRDLLSPAPTEIDELIRISGLDASVVMAAVLALELGGFAVRYPGGRVAST